MYHRAYLALALLALAACGGGGGNPAPIAPSTVAPTSSPTPTSSPSSVTYTAQIVWNGLGASAKDRGAMTMTRKVRSDASSSATPGPIVLAEPDCADPNCADKFEGGPNQEAATASLQISPVPTTTSSPNFNDPGQSIAITYEQPAPNTTATPYALVEAVTPGVTNSSTLTAFSTDPAVSATQTVYIYPRVTLQCNVDGTPGAGGVVFSNGTVTAASSSLGDLYISGPNCPAPYTSTEAGATIHFPAGGTTFGTLTSTGIIALPDVTSGLYSNTETSISFAEIESSEPEGIIFQTASGELVKFEPYTFAPGDANNDSYVAGPYAQQSFSVDSF